MVMMGSSFDSSLNEDSFLLVYLNETTRKKTPIRTMMMAAMKLPR